MNKAKFNLVWDEFVLSPVMESLGVNFVLPASIRAVVMLGSNEGTIEIDPIDASFITSVKKDGIEEAFSLVDGVLTLTPPSRLSVVEITRSGVISFSVFAGEIVPGIRIRENRLRGIVGNIPYRDPYSYRFGIRASWDGRTADTVKTWTASPVDSQISWNTGTLPAPRIDGSLVDGRPFYTIGEFRRGQFVEIAIDLYNPDFTPLLVQYRIVPEVRPAANHFSGELPLGLSISNNPFVIGGFIPAEAIAGEYFVEVFVDEPFGPTPIILHAKVIENEFDRFTAINRLTWSTETDLGTVTEGLPCTFRVRAVNSQGGAVKYRLAEGSRQLPVGLSLTTNGEIRGIPPHFPSDREIIFTVRASSGVFVATRQFKFTIRNRFVRENHLTVTLPLSGEIRRSWQSYADQIDDTRRFRKSDTNFGASSPSILLVRGLDSEAINVLDYDAPFKVILGPFKTARAIQDGKHIYDVIYREMIDPLSKAGGFVFNDADVIPEPVFYPQNNNIRIQETTIRNLRAELVDRNGLNAPESRRRLLGLNGGELLDSWMTTVQPNGKKIGYIAAGIIDYVQPGMGKTVVNNLSYGDLPVGKVIILDRMHIQDGPRSYYYYLGWDRNTGSDSNNDAPLPAEEFRINGIPQDEDTGVHAEPLISWTASQTGVTFNVTFYNGNTILRTLENISETEIFYSFAMQAEDGVPGNIFVEVVAIRSGIHSAPLRGNVKLRAGWGYGWGFRYGGANFADQVGITLRAG